MDINGVRAFVSVADAGSVRDAADELGYSQSAVSRQVTAFERSVGGTVFVRRREGMLLNEFGADLYPLAQEVLAAVKGLAVGPAGTPDRRPARAPDRP